MRKEIKASSKRKLAGILSALLVFGCLGQMSFPLSVKAQETDESQNVAENTPGDVAGRIYASPDGTEAGDGTRENPYDVLTAINECTDGEEIHLEEGTYYFSSVITIKKYQSGRSDAKRALIADGEVIFDFAGHEEGDHSPGLQLEAWNWRVYGIHIRNSGGCGMVVGGNYNEIENCIFESNGNSGLQISTWADGADTVADWAAFNLIKNCTSFNNCDAHNGGEDADGFAAKLRCGEGNVFDGCIAYNNSDDGWDLFAKVETGSIGKVTIRNCVAFRNGILLNGEGTSDGDGNGFKLGGTSQPTPHVVINCLAFENIQTGFTDNNNPSALYLRNCTSVNNANAQQYAGSASNYNFFREENGIKINILSYINAEHAIKRDYFQGTLEHSVYLDNNLEQRYVENETLFEESSVYGDTVAMTDDDFYSVAVPDSNEEVHTLLRDADGTLNLHGLYEVKKGTVYATMADDGGSVGARLSNEQGYTPEENPDIMTEAYTMPQGNLDLSSGLMGDVVCGTYSNHFTVNEFTITAKPEKQVSVDLTSLKYPEDNLVFGRRILMGGSGNKDYRSILYSAGKPATITIYAGSSNASADRTIRLCKEDGTVVEEMTLVAGDVRKLVFTIPEAGNYYVTSANSGWNVYWMEAARTDEDSHDGKDVSGGDVSGGDVSGGDVSGGDVSGGDVSGGDVSEGDLPPVVHEGLEVMLTNPGETYVYDGKPITPEILVLYDGIRQIPGIDYTVKYTNNVNASTQKRQGTITVKGKGNLSGTVKTTFQIEQADIADAVRGGVCVVNGSTAKPVLSYCGLLLGAKDYTVTEAKQKFYLPKDNEARESPVLHVNGKGNFKGSVEIPVTVVAERSALMGFTVSLGKETFSYDGTEKKPTTLVVYDKRDKTRILEEGIHYQVIYPRDIADAGTVKFTVVGIGAYSGAVSKSYVIKPYAYVADQSAIEITSAQTTEYVSTGAALDDISVMIDDTQLVEGVDYKITYSANKKVGTAAYRVTFLGNYKGVPAQKKNFRITPASLADAQVLVPDMTYRKAGLYKSKPYVSVNGAPVKSSDYVVSYYLDETMTQESEMSRKNPVKITEEMLKNGRMKVTVYVKISGKGTNLSSKAEDSVTASYQVQKPVSYDLSKAKVFFEDADGNRASRFEYTGGAIEPGVIVYMGKTPVPECAYDVAYINNTDRGKATAIITANGSDEQYCGSKVGGFRIVAQGLPRNWLDMLFGSK